tara:strand:+ start:3710 stop:4954 length:1245 start_codon:yes stop_codon:yes gene_type:complete
MGILKKIFKGVGKVFKKIGKGIKSAFKKFGKFMGKIGILGQIAMMFILPSIGNSLLANLGDWATTLGAKSSLIAKGMGRILAGAHRFGTVVKAGFNSVTNAITEFGKTALNKVGFNIEGAATNFFSGTDSAFAKTKAGFENIGDVFRATGREGTITAVKEVTVDEMAKNLGMSKENLLKINVGNENIIGNRILEGAELNTDLFSFKATEGAIADAISEETLGLSQAASNRDILKAVTEQDFKAPTGKAITPSDSLLAPDPTVPDFVEEALQKNIAEAGLEEVKKTPIKDFFSELPGKVVQEGRDKIGEIKDRFLDKPIQTTMSLLGGNEEEIDLGRGFATPTYTPDVDISQIGFSELRLPTPQEYYQDNSAQQTYYGTVQSTLAQVAKENQERAFGLYQPLTISNVGPVMQGMR